MENFAFGVVDYVDKKKGVSFVLVGSINRLRVFAPLGEYEPNSYTPEIGDVVEGNLTFQKGEVKLMGVKKRPAK